MVLFEFVHSDVWSSLIVSVTWTQRTFTRNPPRRTQPQKAWKSLLRVWFASAISASKWIVMGDDTESRRNLIWSFMVWKPLSRWIVIVMICKTSGTTEQIEGIMKACIYLHLIMSMDNNSCHVEKTFQVDYRILHHDIPYSAIPYPAIPQHSIQYKAVERYQTFWWSLTFTIGWGVGGVRGDGRGVGGR